jgi:hypothetical protein
MKSALGSISEMPSARFSGKKQFLCGAAAKRDVLI